MQLLCLNQSQQEFIVVYLTAAHSYGNHYILFICLLGIPIPAVRILTASVGFAHLFNSIINKESYTSS